MHIINVRNFKYQKIITIFYNKKKNTKQNQFNQTRDFFY